MEWESESESVRESMNGVGVAHRLGSTGQQDRRVGTVSREDMFSRIGPIREALCKGDECLRGAHCNAHARRRCVAAS